MVNSNYANAYKEVLVILDKLIIEDYNKIPKEYIDFLRANCNNSYQFYYDNSKSFVQQELLDDTKYILFGLFEKFGATDLQKQKIRSFKNSFNKKSEEKKKEKYNPDDIFKNKIEKQGNNINNTISIIPYKKSIFKRILNKIKSILG